MLTLTLTPLPIHTHARDLVIGDRSYARPIVAGIDESSRSVQVYSCVVGPSNHSSDIINHLVSRESESPRSIDRLDRMDTNETGLLLACFVYCVRCARYHEQGPLDEEKGRIQTGGVFASNKLTWPATRSVRRRRRAPFSPRPAGNRS